MGKYRRYRRVRKKSKRRLRVVLSAAGLTLSFLYVLLAVYGSIPIEGEFLRVSIDGLRVLNVTLFRVAYIGSSDNKSYAVQLRIDGMNADFSIPAGKVDSVLVLGTSRLLRAEQDVVQPKIVIPGPGINITYPGPPINTSNIGRSEDYVISHYPLELYFVFRTQLCNVTIHVEATDVSLSRAKFLYSDTEDGAKKEATLRCEGRVCESSLVSLCVLSYDVVSDFTYLSLFKLRYVNRRTELRFADNLWIPIILVAATNSTLFVLYRKMSKTR